MVNGNPSIYFCPYWHHYVTHRDSGFCYEITGK